MKEIKRVYVCSECGLASCWHGEFMCQRSRNADIKLVPVAEVPDHPSHFTRERLEDVYGEIPEEFLAAEGGE